MSQTRFRLRLTSDAQPATGLGLSEVNSLVPRDLNGRPYLPGSHLKGLMRASLKELAYHRTDWKEHFEKLPSVNRKLAWPNSLLEFVFGTDGEDSSSYQPCVRIDDAVMLVDDFADTERFTHLVSRTALDLDGRAKATSLRTAEAIAVGTEFEGQVFSNHSTDSWMGQIWQLALLSVSAVGATRTRGGQCVVELIGEDGCPVPCDMERRLLELTDGFRQWTEDDAKLPRSNAIESPLDVADTKTAVIELIFAAHTPVCFPEHPDRGNVISSGFCIPATAVQGTILHLVNSRSPELATKLFESSQFRCWPLNPCSSLNANEIALAHAADIEQQFDVMPRSIRVSLSHRAAKFTLEDASEADFFDPAVVSHLDAYQWLNPPHGIPLKSSDGVLLTGPGEGSMRQLWRSQMMSRHLTTHGVIDGPTSASETGSRRNLYSVESMVPMCWRGWIVVPESIANKLATWINQQTEFRVGKGRSVRGRGRLIARVSDSLDDLFSSRTDRTALVLQSPVAIPPSLHQQMTDGSMSAEDVLRHVAKSWIEVHGLTSLSESPSVWANASVQFGWNRHDRAGVFQGATAVLQPGSIFSIHPGCDPVRLRKAILAGFYASPDSPDEYRQRGMGCLAVHPGVAQCFYEPQAQRKSANSGQLKLAMIEVSKMRQASHLPRPSQIRSLQSFINTTDPKIAATSLKMARDYLDQQRHRPREIWDAWEPIEKEVQQLLTNFPADIASQALKTLADIATDHHRGRS